MEKDTDIFKRLHGTELGNKLIEYLEEVNREVCDARTWNSGETKEYALMAARLIEERIINKIKNRTERKDLNPNTYV